MGRLRLLVPLVLAAVVALPGPLPAREGPDVVLYLVGDAGRSVPEISLVFPPLAAELTRDRERSVVAILGDNLYPAGLPAPGSPDRADKEARLEAQLVAARAAGRGVVVPGNHDWARWTPDGWNGVRREEAFVTAHGGPCVSFAPSGGCPGPVVFDVGESVRLIALDTHWWLHEYEKPEGPSSPCREKSEDDVVAALREALRTAGARRTVVLAHHPLEAGGLSGSHYTWQDHLFPLTPFVPWLWLPMPVFGSLTVVGRTAFANQQFEVAPRYKALKAAMTSAFDPIPPFVWAAGHDHSLQVIRRPGTSRTWNLISGAGGGTKSVTPVRAIDGTVFCRSVPGYMKIVFERNGPARLAVVAVPAPGRTETIFAAPLD
ncbi:MAG TPA: metallophosphoesterase [Thermoanaerobaculia bacterium]|nr:metallophosphoesterase [Thermoanaerobaculia bacterium]